MKKIRGFFVKHKVATSLFRRKNQSPATDYDPSPGSMSKLFKWGACLKNKAIAMCSKKPGYLKIGQEPVSEKGSTPSRAAVPKGKMAVYVGQNDGDGDSRRVLVPVIYINHPLFGQLLRQAEAEYGYDHRGGITLPCRVSEFENVKTRIAAGCGGRKMMTWKRQ